LLPHRQLRDRARGFRRAHRVRPGRCRVPRLLEGRRQRPVDPGPGRRLLRFEARRLLVPVRGALEGSLRRRQGTQGAADRDARGDAGDRGARSVEEIRDRPELMDLAALEAAAALVHGVVPPTPQYRWPLLSRRGGAEVWVKHENHTPIGAFKVRGGVVYLDDLRRAQPQIRGVVTATTGNHGQSSAYSAAALGLAATIVVPQGNNPGKNRAMRGFGATLVQVGHDFQAAYEHAMALAEREQLHLVRSFHPLLVRGVASYALELFHAVADL